MLKNQENLLSKKNSSVISWQLSCFFVRHGAILFKVEVDIYGH